MKLKIVVIDDEESIRDTFQWHLESLGHEVITASEPSTCDIYQGHVCGKACPCADVLITDYRMPRMTGLEFLELLAKRGCRVLKGNRMILSGSLNDIDAERVRRLGCAVRQKPLNFAGLEEWLDGCIERIAAQRSGRVEGAK